MKTILLKIARLINRHYEIIELKLGDTIKFEGHLFTISNIYINLDLNGTNEINIEGIDSVQIINNAMLHIKK